MGRSAGRGLALGVRHLGNRYLFAVNRYSPANVSRIEFVLPGQECKENAEVRSKNAEVKA